MDDNSAAATAEHVQATVTLMRQVLNAAGVESVFMVATAARLSLDLLIRDAPVLRQAAQLHTHTASHSSDVYVYLYCPQTGWENAQLCVLSEIDMQTQ